MDTFIEQLADILEVEASILTPQTVFREVSHWDSLAYMSTIAMIDAEFGVVIPLEDFRELKTIADIDTYLKEHNSM